LIKIHIVLRSLIKNSLKCGKTQGEDFYSGRCSASSRNYERAVVIDHASVSNARFVRQEFHPGSL
jgi:hypothetical protein